MLTRGRCPNSNSWLQTFTFFLSAHGLRPENSRPENSQLRPRPPKSHGHDCHSGHSNFCKRLLAPKAPNFSKTNFRFGPVRVLYLVCLLLLTKPRIEAPKAPSFCGLTTGELKNSCWARARIQKKTVRNATAHRNTSPHELTTAVKETN